MGKLEHDLQILHFSHPHPLDLNSNHQTLEPNMISTKYMPCASCKLLPNNSDDYIYSCIPCNFHLHKACTQFPQLISHTSHPSHPLTLLPVSSYPGGLFNCDACNRRGNGFSYHCHVCDFDLHVACASMQLSVVHYSHIHPLVLTFKNPYEAKGFSCDICSKIGSKQWLYRCGICDFDAHLHCATGVIQPPQPQIQVNKFQAPVVAGRPSGKIYGKMQGQQSLPIMNNRPNNGIQKQQSYPGGGGIMSAAFQGLVGGAAQQVGQTLVQSLMGGGDGGDGDGGTTTTTTIYVNVEPTSTEIDDSGEADAEDY
ncbi:putative Cysteine/Histidine-rich C1 domain family protein [Heracleum sosnowskyi]|uniref:Cysteine/Histidine-rich C1 domain family protein n=1 Tax=Heracleum sosnowskyi TaxID=360622 RepID=A0AAD8JKE7_9APIA|nr:putative Cysteine/Histidine-rich C1 domain family protein [Heracleum sosnowskyi]